MATKKTETKEETTALATTGTTALADPRAIPDYGEDYGKGYEGVTTSTQSVPWCYLVQPNSPIVSDEKRNPPIRAGQWLYTLPDQAFDKDRGFLFLPAYTRRAYAEWTPRDEGKGFHGLREPSDPVVLQALAEMKRYGKLKFMATEYDKNENEVKKLHILVETHYLWGVIMNEDLTPDGPACLAFKSTAIRPFQQWQSRIGYIRDGAGRRPPMWSHLTRITSHQEKRDQNIYYVPDFRAANEGGYRESLVGADNAGYPMAREYNTLLLRGAIQQDFEKSDAGDGAGDADIPF